MGLFSIDTGKSVDSAIVSAQSNLKLYDQMQMSYLKMMVLHDLLNATKRMISLPYIYNGIDLNPYADRVIKSLSNQERLVFLTFEDKVKLKHLILDKLDVDEQLVKSLIECIQLKVQYG